MSSSPAYVLDGFAFLAFLESETGMRRVGEILEAAARQAVRVYLSGINLGEIAYIIERERGLPAVHQVLAAIDQLPIKILPAGRDVVLDAAHVKARYPISYADAFAAASALDTEAVLVTGVPEFRALQAELSIEWLENNSPRPV